MSNLTGIIDEPVEPGSKDSLGIELHSKSLIKFVERTQTPITIGIQGEWGSGKTSLINSIYHHFDKKCEVKQIWINAWEYSLLSTPEEALLKILNKILDELIKADKPTKTSDDIKKGAKQIFKGALRVGAHVALGNEASKVATELLQSSDQNVSQLRKQLTSLVDEIATRDSNPYNKIVIYVDDLDRIEPKHAVSILELLKNIFSVPNCVFVLAIEFQVVVTGLTARFGKQTPENEWKFRAFFDKIIQLPFAMPMNQYDIGKYVITLLKTIGFVDAGELNEEAIQDIILWTIGGNPRSIKRLVNSVSLIQIFKETKSEQKPNNNFGEEKSSAEHEQFLLFSLLCLQIAYPQIYSLLNKRPNFLLWDQDFAFQETDKAEEKEKEFFERDFSIAQQSQDCDEDWEQALFRICYSRPRLKPRFKDISRFLSHIQETVLTGQSDYDLGDLLSEILNQTSVTSVTMTNTEQQGPPKGAKNIFDANTWQGLLAVNLNRNEIEKVDEILSVLKTGSKYLKINFSKSDGASFYHPETGKVCMRMKVGGGQNDKKLIIYSLFRDFAHKFNLPRIKGFEVESDPKPFKDKNRRWFGGFSVFCSIETLNNEKLKIINDIASRNYELHNNVNSEYRDYLKDISKKIHAGDEEATQWCDKIFSLDPYDYI